MSDVCSEERHIRDSAYFINSTVHTSKEIWAWKSIEKLMNAFYWWEATPGTTAPSSGNKLKLSLQSNWGQKRPMSI